jgi:glycosyltransferase involved in cell wall biosynthesis
MSDDALRVLFLASKIRLRSSCLFMLELARGLLRGGCQVRVLCSSVGAHEAIAAAQVPVQEWADIPGSVSLLLPGRMRRLLREWGIGLVHVHGQSLGLFGRRLLSSPGVPIVYTPQPFQFAPGAVASTASRACRVIALSQDVRGECVNLARMPKEKITLIRQGVDLEGVPALPPRLDRHEPVVGAVGPLTPGKGQDTFLRAVRRIVDSGRRGQFVIAGDGPQETPLRRLCRDLDLESAVTFVTRLGHYQGALDSLDIFVRPCVSGGLAFTLLKAMAMAKAAVATGIGCVYDMIQDGITGRLVGRDRPDALADALSDLLDNPERAVQLGRRAREFVRANFGIEDTVRRTLDLYDGALHGVRA